MLAPGVLDATFPYRSATAGARAAPLRWILATTAPAHNGDLLVGTIRRIRTVQPAGNSSGRPLPLAPRARLGSWRKRNITELAGELPNFFFIRVAGAPHQPEMVVLQVGVAQERHQRAARNLALREIARQDGDPGALQQPVAHRADRSQIFHRFEIPSLAGRARVEEIAEERQVGMQVEEGVPAGIGGTNERILRKHLGTRHHDVVFTMQQLVAQIPHRDARAADRTIDTPAANARQQILVAEIEVQGALGSRPAQVCQRRSEPRKPELETGSDGELEGGFFPCPGGIQAASSFLEGAPRLMEQTISFGGQRHLAGGPDEEPTSDLILETANPISERSRRQTHRGGRAAKIQKGSGSFETSQRFEVRQHARASPSDESRSIVSKAGRTYGDHCSDEPNAWVREIAMVFLSCVDNMYLGKKCRYPSSVRSSPLPTRPTRGRGGSATAEIGQGHARSGASPRSASRRRQAGGNRDRGRRQEPRLGGGHQHGRHVALDE